MKKFFLLIVFGILTSMCYGQQLDGLYKGVSLDKVVNNQVAVTNGHNTPYKFNKLFYLKIRKDSAYLDVYYADIAGSDTVIYKSDGISDFFNGTFKVGDNLIRFKLSEVVVNFFEQGIRTNKKGEFLGVIRRRNEFLGKRTKCGILIDGVLFKKTKERINLISENPKSFNKSMPSKIRLMD